MRVNIISSLLLAAGLVVSVAGSTPARQDGFIWTGSGNKAVAMQTVFRKTFTAPDVSKGMVQIFADARYIL